MNRSQRNNNPVNLRYAQQFESSGKDDAGFAIFPTPEAGWRAAHRQIKLDQSRELTLEQFINKFAPPNENDTSAYLQFIAMEFDMFPDTPLSQFSPYALAGVMAKIEGYYNE